MKPLKCITDPSFVYYSAARTDIRRTFRRARALLKAEAEKPKASVAQIKPKVAR